MTPIRLCECFHHKTPIAKHDGRMASEKKDMYLPYAITFAAGASYGMTTVIVGQPLDTVKTRMQGMSKASINSSGGPVNIFFDLYKKEGFRGLYRGGSPLIIGGSMMRSAQFGVR